MCFIAGLLKTQVGRIAPIVANLLTAWIYSLGFMGGICCFGGMLPMHVNVIGPGMFLAFSCG